MRVNDSLQNDESFFFAELKRLQRIIAELDKPQKTFIILDEILRGTNSNDKRAGTQGLIKNLISKNAVGIIATHDLVISEMKKDFPDYLANNCFEAEITNDELRFDYKLRTGVCQQMSAAFLMEKMGIIER
jgi:DNA mismatch repair ATPase MutS